MVKIVLQACLLALMSWGDAGSLCPSFGQKAPALRFQSYELNADLVRGVTCATGFGLDTGTTLAVQSTPSTCVTENNSLLRTRGNADPPHGTANAARSNDKPKPKPKPEKRATEAFQVGIRIC